MTQRLYLQGSQQGLPADRHRAPSIVHILWRLCHVLARGYDTTGNVAEELSPQQAYALMGEGESNQAKRRLLKAMKGMGSPHGKCQGMLSWAGQGKAGHELCLYSEDGFYGDL